MQRDVLISIGSNHLAPAHMEQVKDLLTEVFGDNILFSSVIQTQAVGIDSPDFLNCVAAFTTPLDYTHVRNHLKHMETVCGNTPAKRRHNKVEMDIDILSFDGQHYHQKDWDRDYIQGLVKELEGHEVQDSTCSFNSINNHRNKRDK